MQNICSTHVIVFQPHDIQSDNDKTPDSQLNQVLQ